MQKYRYANFRVLQMSGYAIVRDAIVQNSIVLEPFLLLASDINLFIRSNNFTKNGKFRKTYSKLISNDKKESWTRILEQTPGVQERPLTTSRWSQAEREFYFGMLQTRRRHNMPVASGLGPLRVFLIFE